MGGTQCSASVAVALPRDPIPAAPPWPSIESARTNEIVGGWHPRLHRNDDVGDPFGQGGRGSVRAGSASVLASMGRAKLRLGRASSQHAQTRLWVGGARRLSFGRFT